MVTATSIPAAYGASCRQGQNHNSGFENQHRKYISSLSIFPVFLIFFEEQVDRRRLGLERLRELTGTDHKDKRVLGTEHPSTATTYNNMALVFRAQGEYEKALEYYGKALAISERVLGREHPSTAATYNNMALVFRAQGDYEKALEYYEKALSVLKMKLGENHSYTQSAQLSVQIMELLIDLGINEEQLMELIKQKL